MKVALYARVSTQRQEKQGTISSQARHEANQQFSPRNLHEEHWLLRRLVRCEKCGLKCACVADRRRPHMPPSYYYRCEKQDRVPGRPRCRPNHIRSEPLDKLVWQEIRRHLLNPELLLKAHAMVKDTQYLDQSFLATQIQNAKKRLEKLEAQSDGASCSEGGTEAVWDT